MACEPIPFDIKVRISIETDASESWVRQRIPKVSRAVDDMSRDRRETIDWDDLKHTLCCIYKRTTELRAMDLSNKEIEAIKSMLIVKFK